MLEQSRHPLSSNRSEGAPVDNILPQAAVITYAGLSIPLSEVESLRAKPGESSSIAQISKTLRNSDPQTVAGVAALLQAIAKAGWQNRSFADWGIVGCPRFVGRMVICNVIWRFFTDPKYSINPHIIPNYSLHSPSGTASVAMRMHGQNLGVGGGPGNAAEGLVTALSILDDGRLPGIWLLLSEFEPEPRPDEQGNATNEVHVHAVAMALQKSANGVGTLKLNWNSKAHGTSASIKDLVSYLSVRATNPWDCIFAGLGKLELTVGSDRQ
jgi:hypothetical protein